MLRRAIPLIAGLGLAAAASAETTSVLMAEGDWTLYGIDGYVFTMWDEPLELQGICLAETVSGEDRLQFALFFREWKTVDPELIGLLLGQILLPGQEIEAGTRNLKFQSGTSDYVIQGAEYTPQRLSVMVQAQHAPLSALHLLAAMGDDRITLDAPDGTEIAAFSAVGFGPVLEALMDCGGIAPP